MSSSNVNSVFYADRYHPIQAGSIDGIDTHPHDNAVYRALLCSNASLYDPFGDPKVIGDPYCTLFVGRLSHITNEEAIRKAMSNYGNVKDLRLVRHVVTGASRGYAFVTFETEREMRRAYKEAHHTSIDGSEILVDYNRQRLMPGWIPRRLGGGLGGKKESGQLRFGGRERPFRAPLKQIPYDELQKLGIPLPPEGRYMSRFQVPSPPRRKRSKSDDYDASHDEPKQSASRGRERSSSSVDLSHKQSRHEKDSRKRGNSEGEELHREHSKRRRASSRQHHSRGGDGSSYSEEEHHHEHHKRSKKHQKRLSSFEESSDREERDYRRCKRDSYRREHSELD